MALLNVAIPEARSIAAKAVPLAEWLIRPTGWPPILMLGFVLTTALTLLLLLRRS